jgi:hypothetical protein
MRLRSFDLVKKVAVQTLRWKLYGAAVCLIVIPLYPISVRAESGLYRGQDGSTGTVADLGNGTMLYADPHGTFGPLPGSAGGTQGGPVPLPQGYGDSGHITPFGTPTPPSQLTPAPVLPFHPHGMLMPQQPGTPVPSFSPKSGGSGSGFRGR